VFARALRFVHSRSVHCHANELELKLWTDSPGQMRGYDEKSLE
jgi:hypothetical protein